MRHRLLLAGLIAVAFGCSPQGASPQQPLGSTDAAPIATPEGGRADGTTDAGGAADAGDASVQSPSPSDSGATPSDGDADASAATTSVEDAAGDAADSGLILPPFPTLPTTSAACKPNPPTGSLNLTNLNPDGGAANYIVRVPPGSKPTTALPLVFGFHGRGRTNAQFEDVDALDIMTEIEPFAITVYPQSQGGPGWEMAPELPVNVPFFVALWTQMFSNYCVDPARVFVMGHSSGAIFSNILACEYGDRLRGVGAVASTLPVTDCVGHVAAMLVHGGADPIIDISLGIAARDSYLQRNGCQMTSMPGQVAPCVAYLGCRSDLPVQWCEHTEPTYTMTDGGGHGYPTFASKAIGQFFFALQPKTSQ